MRVTLIYKGHTICHMFKLMQGEILLHCTNLHKFFKKLLKCPLLTLQWHWFCTFSNEKNQCPCEFSRHVDQLHVCARSQLWSTFLPILLHTIAKWMAITTWSWSQWLLVMLHCRFCRCCRCLSFRRSANQSVVWWVLKDTQFVSIPVVLKPSSAAS